MQSDERLRAMGMLQTGRSQCEIANTFSVSKSVISRLRNRYQQTQDVDDRHRSGRPRATTKYRIDSSVTRLYKIDLKRQIKCLQTFIRLLVSELRVRRLEIVFMQPIRNRLHAAHVYARRSWVVPTLTNCHTAHRREWCR